MGVAFRELRGGAPGGDYVSRALVDCRGAPIVDTAFMGLTSWGCITIVATITRIDRYTFIGDASVNRELNPAALSKNGIVGA
jgi:hypothetical protein